MLRTYVALYVLHHRSGSKHVGNSNGVILVADIYISPHSRDIEMNIRAWNRSLLNAPVIFTTNLGLLFGPVETFSIFLNVNIPSITLPKTTCFPSKKSHLAVVMKNWEKNALSLLCMHVD